MSGVENYFNLSANDQITIIQSLKAGNSEAEEAWYETFSYMHCEGDEYFQDEEELNVLGELAQRVRDNTELSKREHREIGKVIGLIMGGGEIGAQFNSLKHVYREEDDPEIFVRNTIDFLNNELRKGENPQFTLKTVHIPVRLRDSSVADWEVVKLAPHQIADSA